MSDILTRNAINKDFSRNPQMQGQRSAFRLNNKRIQTMNGGYLVPIYCKPTLPGDTWTIHMDEFMRFMPQVAAVMDRTIVKTFWFWERNPNLWEHFENMMGMKKNPNDTTDYVVPAITIPAGGFEAGTIYDYLKIPIKRGKNRKISALPFRMYNRIYNKYFRSEQLQDEIIENNGDADDTPDMYELKKINKLPDYFTRNLIDTQMGEEVSIPIGTKAPVIGNGNALGIAMPNASNNETTDSDIYGILASRLDEGFAQSDVYMGTINSNGTPTDFEQGIIKAGTQIYPITGQNNRNNKALAITKNAEYSGLIADLSTAVSAKVLAFRNALALQHALELDNRTGTRYTEILQGRYKMLVPDAFLNRPLYIGGTTIDMTTVPVIQTSETTNTSPQGNISGNTFGGDEGIIECSVPDFGYIMGLAVVTVEPQYQQGLDRMYNQFTRYDFFHPEFNSVGDQATYNYEIYLQDEDVVDDEGTPINNLPFGYNERLSEYKTAVNEICGYMRSDADITLDIWHYGEKFENLPTLNETFITSKAEEMIKRSLSVKELTIGNKTINAPQILADFNFSATVYRGIPVYNMPGLQLV